MTVIGITGGIGCGKSEVCKYLREKYGACVLTADTIAHEVIQPGGEAYDEYFELFGPEFVLPDGSFDRKKIGDLVFKDPVLLDKLNGIIHPAVHRTILSRIRQAEEAGTEVCVVEAALLIEADYRDICTEYWYVYADVKTRINRLLKSRDITEDKIDSIMSRQQSEETFRQACDFTVDNSGSFAITSALIDSRIAELRSRI